MKNKTLGIRLTVNLLMLVLLAVPLSASADEISPAHSLASNTESPSVQSEPVVDFGEEGDIILQVYLRDILLTDAMFAIMQNGNIYLPLAEIAYLLDFPIIVDSAYGHATGWYLAPANTFSLDRPAGIATVKGRTHTFSESDVLADEVEIYVDSKLMQEWFPLFIDVSLSSQVMTIRSSEKLPKELALERSARSAGDEVTYAATREFDIPGYRALDWPELSVSLGSFYAPESDIARYDYRVRAVGDFAFMNGFASFSGNDKELTGATITLGRQNPRGMLGPLRIADYEVGDTSQFLPSLLGNSLSGRGVRFSNTRLADQRDIDTIDLQGEQQADYEIELYVNDRLRAVDRDSSDNTYDFQDVRLQLGQNEVRLEFYGPQGQRHTESSRSFVGSNQGRQGRFTYEFALMEPDRKVYDLFEEIEADSENEEIQPIQLSSALTMSYGLTRRTGIALTIASLATDIIDSEAINNQSKNRNYINTKVTTDISGTLLSTDVSIDPNGSVAAALAARSSFGDYEFGISQRVAERAYRTINDINNEETVSSTRLATDLNVTRDYFGIPSGRLSYGANASFNIDSSDEEVASVGTQLDYRNTILGASWSHNYRRDIALGSGNSNGQISASIRASDRTLWTFSSDVDYSDDQQRLFNSGSLRLARPLAKNGGLSFTASRDLQESSTGYSASWNRQFRNFRFDSTIAGTSSDDLSLRFGIDFAAKRYPGRWLPTITSAGGSTSVAVIVFADDNNNGKHDDTEQLIEGIRLTRNGLITDAVTNRDGAALVTGLSTNTSVDIGIIASDIKEPDLKFNGIPKGVLPRPGRVPLILVPLQRATDLEGTVMISSTRPAPNVRMLLTPVDEGESMEIYTEFDGYYYLAGIPQGAYQFGPDPEQLQSAGLVSQPPTRLLVLENLDDFPEPEDFNLVRIAELGTEPQLGAALPGNNSPIPTLTPLRAEPASPITDSVLPDLPADPNPLLGFVTWEETKSSTDSTAQNQEVDLNSPALDSDNDGILNIDDRCEHTSRESKVNKHGCVYVSEQLPDAYFAPKSANLTSEIVFGLIGLARELKHNPALKIKVETHTDHIGTADTQKTLAKRRAHSILHYLTRSLDVPPSQLSVIATEEAQSVVSNNTRAGQQYNRRIMINLAKSE